MVECRFPRFYEGYWDDVALLAEEESVKSALSRMGHTDGSAMREFHRIKCGQARERTRERIAEDVRRIVTSRMLSWKTGRIAEDGAH